MRNFKSKVSKFSDKPLPLLEALVKLTNMDPQLLKTAALNGAVWLQRKSVGKVLRVRDERVMLHPSDSLSFFFDAHVLKMPELKIAINLFENEHYGIWFKEAGVVTQGTQTGDQTSLLRYIEKKHKSVYLIHRLDRETAGVMVFAYTKEAAAKFSDLFQRNEIQKIYQAVVLGSLPKGEEKTIDSSLDGKEARTHYKVLASDESRSLLEIQLETGRLHQIRRHLDFINHPVMGDPKYGKNNKNRAGLQLLAQTLAFVDPWTDEAVSWTAPRSLDI